MNSVDSEKLRNAAAEMVWQRRKQAGLTQETVSERSGLGRSYVSDLENAKCSPSVDALFRLAVAFRVSPVQLIEEIERGISKTS